MFTVRSVLHRYADKTVLAAPELSLADREHCVVAGPSGSGKSTLLNIMAGIMRPSEGEVALDGESLYTSPPRDDRWRARLIAMVPQRLHLLPSLSAEDNIRLAIYLSGAAVPDASVSELLDVLGLAARAGSKPSDLSVGEQQRVAIARAVVHRPRVLLADEPTSSLDDHNAQRAVDLLFEAARLSGALLVVATHDARIRERFNRIVQLEAPCA